MSNMTQAETELRRELGEAEARCASWREVLRLEREHNELYEDKLAAMTERATQAEAKWHRAATHDSILDEAEVIHELRQEIVGLQAKHENLALTLIEQERLYDVLHECIEGKEGWREQRETAVKVMEQQQQEIARLTDRVKKAEALVLILGVGRNKKQIERLAGTKEGAGAVPPPVS